MSEASLAGDTMVSCAHCHFYRELSAGSGDCHRYPPIFAAGISPNEKHLWRQPLVHQHAWCGEFRPAKSH